MRLKKVLSAYQFPAAWMSGQESASPKSAGTRQPECAGVRPGKLAGSTFNWEQRRTAPGCPCSKDLKEKKMSVTNATGRCPTDISEVLHTQCIYKLTLTVGLKE